MNNYYRTFFEDQIIIDWMKVFPKIFEFYNKRYLIMKLNKYDEIYLITI